MSEIVKKKSENNTPNAVTIYNDWGNRERVDSDVNKNNRRVGSETNLSTKCDESNQNQKCLSKNKKCLIAFIISSVVVVIAIILIVVFVFVKKNDNSNNSHDNIINESNDSNENLGDNSNSEEKDDTYIILPNNEKVIAKLDYNVNEM